MNPLSTVKRLITMALARAVVAGMKEDSGLRRLNLKILADEVKDGVEHFEPYGYSSRPLTGAEALVVALGGNRDHVIGAVVTDRRHRPKNLEPGEVVIFDDQGQEVRITRGHIEVKAPKVVVLSDDVHLGAEGGPKVARIGDRVQVDTGSSAGMWPIVEGSSKVQAAN